MRERNIIRICPVILVIIANLACIFVNGCGTVDARTDINKCPIHGEPLKEDTVWIHYGLPAFDEEYMKASSELFPYANHYYLGGCCVQSEKRALVKYCPKCRKAEKEWEKVHSKRV
jgi:hypothetical protein